MILYLGLQPPNSGAFHYPVIRTEPLLGGELERAKALWPSFSHLIFTSPRAVAYWALPFQGKEVVAIGAATAAALRTKGCKPQIAAEATQEGVAALLCKMPISYACLPQSRRAREVLARFLREQNIPFYAFSLYDTQLQKPGPAPDLALFSEIVFTSPSTVAGFLAIYGRLPSHAKLTAIGPVTQRAIEENFSQRV